MKCAPEQADPRHATPVMPEEKRQVKESLEEAIREVHSPDQAERVLDDLEEVAAGVSEAEAAQGAEASRARPAEVVKQVSNPS